MKISFFTAILFITACGISITASGQKRHSKKKKELAAQSVKFIEDIEINRDIHPKTEAANTIVPIPAISGLDIEKSQHIQFKYAQLLNCNVEAIKNLRLFTFIDDWWEIRYCYGGMTKAGVDCSAFSGILLSNVFTTGIPRTAKEQYDSSEKIEKEKLVEGDLVFFNTRGGISHVGVYLADGYFVHASTTSGVTINNLNDDYYSSRFLGGGRILPSVEQGMVNAGSH